MRYCLLAVLVLFCTCSDTPSEPPVDSYRDVEFSIDMNEAIDNSLFNLGVDSLLLTLDSTDQFQMIDNDNDNIFTYVIPDLIFGQSYQYGYMINDTSEDLDGQRSFTVNDENNLIFDYYGELNPTTLIFLVNMSYQIELGNFNPDTQFLDIAGTFNSWQDPYSSNYNLVPSDNNNTIYTITITNIEVAVELEFKFRIDGDWDLAEFPGGGSNRTYIPVQGENILELWYSDESGD